MNLSSDKIEARGDSWWPGPDPPSAEDELVNVSRSLCPSRPVLSWENDEGRFDNL